MVKTPTATAGTGGDDGAGGAVPFKVNPQSAAMLAWVQWTSASAAVPRLEMSSVAVSVVDQRIHRMAPSYVYERPVL
jgi:hypothetical protein